MTTRFLTGITTSGTPHLGNYAGAIRPAIAASRRGDAEAFYFLADYHALIKCDDPARIARSRLEIAATWLAAGLDPQRVTLYQQSDIPEIPQLTWLLTCVTAKGLLNRAHAYKAAVDQNTAKGEDADAAITAGLYMYPVLMAADILMFNATHVPVGRDQVQHIEMARDVGQRFNHLYGKAWRAAGGKDEPFVLPEVAIEESVATLPGLDGRKMSKSYDNTIPLFEGGAKATRAAVLKIVTDSRAPGEAKDPDSSSLFAIYRAFASDAESAAFRAALEDGLGWGEAKQQLCARIEQDIGPLRARYEALIAHPDDIEDALAEGARKARAIAAPRIETMRRAVGLGRLGVARSHSPHPNPPPHAGEGDERAARVGEKNPPPHARVRAGALELPVAVRTDSNAGGRTPTAGLSGERTTREPDNGDEHAARVGGNPLPPLAGTSAIHGQELRGALRADGGNLAKRPHKRARIVSFRDDTGFRFRLVGADGEALLLSRAFADPKAAGLASRQLASEGADAALQALDATRFAFMHEGEVLAAGTPCGDTAARDTALERTRDALAALREGAA